MIRKNHTIIFLAGRYVTRFFAEKLSGDLVFHNFHHTSKCGAWGVRNIGGTLNLSKNDLISWTIMRRNFFF
ncbi:MAG: hypothetical protein ACI9LN_004095 [Saprospiraceae bacterium]|jgi:hypothetical protein